MTNADAANLIDRVDALIAAGMSPQDAQRMATADLGAEIDAEIAESQAAVREQHADLFVPPKKGGAEMTPPIAEEAKPESKFFGKPAVKRLADDAALQEAWLSEQAQAMGYRDIDQLVDRDFDGFMTHSQIASHGYCLVWGVSAQPARAEESQDRPTGLLEQQHVEWMDPGAAGTDGRVDPHLAPVGEVHRAEVTGG